MMPVRALHRKLFRDLGKMKGQVVAVSLVMACGLAMMIMARSLIHSLETTRDAYYSEHRFADVFCECKRAPNTLRKRIAEIDGVAAVETRVSGGVILEIPGMAEPADGAIHSLPDDRPQQLHKLFLREGRLPAPGSRGEVVAGEAFASAHGLRPGNTIDAVIYGARQRLTIVGTALSPEYVFEARAGETLPDNRRFGVFWMNERELSYAFNLKGAFNSVLIDLSPGADAKSVMENLDRLLAPYGGLISYGRRDHPSALRLDDELRVLHGLSYAFPAVFLSIAAFMVSAVLSRVVRLQREQIAQIKAFGYTSAQVGWHYLQFALVIVVLGTILGSIGGVWLGTGVVSIYHRFFRFPALTFQPDFASIATALVVSVAAAFAGVLGAVRQAVTLPPAEAMRPEPPADYRPSLLERLGLSQLAGPSFRMSLRNIERAPWQSFFTALGLALATGIPIVPGAMRDGINHLLEFTWDRKARQDVTVSLIEPGSASALYALQKLPGVQQVQPFRSVPARLSFGHRTRRLSIIGVARDSPLSRELNSRSEPLNMPLNGVLVSAKLAEILGAQPGDTIRIEVQEGRRPVLQTRIHGLVTDYTGVSAYMDLEALHRLMREGGTVSGAHLAVDGAEWPRFLDAVRETPVISTMSIKASTRDSFRKSTAEMIGLIQSLYFGFSIVIAFGVVYNSARISLAERSRDLATLRVIGFTHREVAGVMIGELAVLTLVAMPFGLGIGTLLADFIIRAADSEAVRLPLVLTPRSYATAVLIVSVSAAVSFLVVIRRIRDLDLLGVLKARD